MGASGDKGWGGPRGAARGASRPLFAEGPRTVKGVDRDDELAHDTEDFARTAAVPRIVGYTGGHVEADTNRFFISKIYLLKEHRGEGLCSATIRFYERLARERGLDALYLTVNKHNEMAIRAYKAKGFEVIDAVETDIGDGYIMDDYIMEKKLQ